MATRANKLFAGILILLGLSIPSAEGNRATDEYVKKVVETLNIINKNSKLVPIRDSSIVSFNKELALLEEEISNIDAATSKSNLKQKLESKLPTLISNLKLATLTLAKRGIVLPEKMFFLYETMDSIDLWYRNSIRFLYLEPQLKTKIQESMRIMKLYLKSRESAFFKYTVSKDYLNNYYLLNDPLGSKFHSLLLQTQSNEDNKAALFAYKNKSTSHNLLHTAMSFQNIPAIKNVLFYLPELLTTKDNTGITPLRDFAIVPEDKENPKRETFFTFIENHRNQQSGNNALHISVREGLIDETKLLINNHPKLIFNQNHSRKCPFELDNVNKDILKEFTNLVDLSGNNPLHYAVKSSNTKLITNLIRLDKFLLLKPNKFSKTPLDLLKGDNLQLVIDLLPKGKKEMKELISTKREASAPPLSIERGLEAAQEEFFANFKKLTLPLTENPNNHDLEIFKNCLKETEDKGVELVGIIVKKQIKDSFNLSKDNENLLSKMKSLSKKVINSATQDKDITQRITATLDEITKETERGLSNIEKTKASAEINRLKNIISSRLVPQLENSYKNKLIDFKKILTDNTRNVKTKFTDFPKNTPTNASNTKLDKCKREKALLYCADLILTEKNVDTTQIASGLQKIQAETLTAKQEKPGLIKQFLSNAHQWLKNIFKPRSRN